MPIPNATTIASLLRDSLAQGNHPVLTVTSNSMSPIFRAGDAVVIEAADVKRLQQGDIIVVQMPAALQTHRYWGLGGPAGEHIVTRGDRPLTFDPLLSASSLVGRVHQVRYQNRQLKIDSGAGSWLNQQLKRLAEREMQFWALVKRRPTFAQVPQNEQEINSFGQLRQPDTISLTIRRLFHAWAWLLVRLIRLFASQRFDTQ